MSPPPPLSAPSRRGARSLVGGLKRLRAAPPAESYFDLWLGLGGPLFFGPGEFEAAVAVATALGDPDHNWALDPGSPALARDLAEALLATAPAAPT